MKFRNLNIKSIELLNSKRNLKIKARRIYCLIKEHNNLCLMLNHFNIFWKRLLFLIFSFYVILIWSTVFIPVVYTGLDLIPRSFMYLVMIETIGTFFYISFILFNISSEVI